MLVRMCFEEAQKLSEEDYKLFSALSSLPLLSDVTKSIQESLSLIFGDFSALQHES